MDYTPLPPPTPGPVCGPRALETVLNELDVLADELVTSAGPDAVAGGGESAGAGGVAVPRLVDAAPRLRALTARLDTVRLTWLPVIEARHPWQATGARTFSAWLARTENVSTTTANREARTGRVLRDHLPTTRAAALAGGIGVDHVRALVDVAPTSEARRAALAAPIEPEQLPPSPAGTPEAPDDGGGRAAGTADGTGAGLDDDPVGGKAPVDPAAIDVDLATNGDTRTAPPVITGEGYLTGLAGACDPARFRRVLKRFGQVADPDADDRGYRQATEREHLEVSPTFGGWHVNGFLTDEHGHLLSTALGSMMGAPAAGDDRTPTQRRAQALADLARDVLDNGRVGSGAAVRPHVHVTVSLTELLRSGRSNSHGGRGDAGSSDAGSSDAGSSGADLGDADTTDAGPTGTGTSLISDATGSRHGLGGPALDLAGGNAGNVGALRPGDLTALTAQPATFTGASTTGSVVPRDLLRRLLCDAEVTRVVFGADGTAIDVGRSQRTVTGQMRKAVIARDQHCVYPGCDQPPSRCEVHHALRHWADGGETSVANSALLCWHHHTLVDTTGITMAWKAGPTPDQPGRWSFTSRHGRRIGLPWARDRAA
ncbi:DUF222 domain-containing protein [Promicromonospora sp. NPDC019610]|uniref:HNH endonuclease signature motif containing protein n=1 Tax=Promicromonospora sp. NPDC019610 TaxID=3364405 RepID=UPI0037A5AA6B